jgi:hypothetical protein
VHAPSSTNPPGTAKQPAAPLSGTSTFVGRELQGPQLRAAVRWSGHENSKAALEVGRPGAVVVSSLHGLAARVAVLGFTPHSVLAISGVTIAAN